MQASHGECLSSPVGHMSVQLYCVRGDLDLGGPGTEAGWSETKAQVRMRMGGSDSGAPGSRGKGKGQLLK